MMPSTSARVAARAPRAAQGGRRAARLAVPRAGAAPEGGDAPVSVAEPAEAEEAAAAPKDILDPADGTVQYAAPQGDAGTELVSNLFSLFKDGRASETINGRCAQMGFTVAAYLELTTDKSVREQLFITREISRGIIQKTINYPQAGFFLALATVVLVTAGSIAPAFNGKEKNGLNETPEDFGPFRAEAELTNSRAAMVGLAALSAIEGFTGSALL